MLLIAEEIVKPEFNVSAALFKRLAGELFADAAAALTELVKNAYDAGATHLKIEINTQGHLTLPNLYYQNDQPGFIKIEDNGKGMLPEDVANHWLTFYSSPKKKGMESGHDRTATGGQGMGRLGTALLGERVELFTSAAREGPATHVAFDWQDFEEKKLLTKVPVHVANLERTLPRGTVIVIHPLSKQADWSAAGLAELQFQLSRKISPFVAGGSVRVTLILNDKSFELERIKPVPNSHEIRIENVWQQVTPALQKEIVEFWKAHQMMIAGVSAEERALQAVLIVRSEADNSIVGISTAMVVRFKQLNERKFFYYRSIVLPEFRQPGLASKIIVDTRDFLESISQPAQKDSCIGLITFVESPAIKQAKRQAVWPDSKMIFMGMDKNGRQIRVYYFRGARI